MACGQGKDSLDLDEHIDWTYTDTLSVAHWNIGHFSLGRANDTAISGFQSDSLASLYHAMLDTLNADILGVCEYNSSFNKSGGSARSIIFGDYPYFETGEQYSYNFNAIFSQIKLYDPHISIFEKCVQTRYFIDTTLKINDHSVRFIETHLDWNEGPDGADFRREQIRQLVDIYSKEPYVILCADYNTDSGIEEFAPFLDAGFSLANPGGLTYPAAQPKSPLDNILTRGFIIDTADIICNPGLSDHCLLRSRLIFIYD